MNCQRAPIAEYHILIPCFNKMKIIEQNKFLKLLKRGIFMH